MNLGFHLYAPRKIYGKQPIGYIGITTELTYDMHNLYTGRKEVQSNRESKSKFNFNLLRPLDHHLVPLFIEKYRKLPPMNLGCAQVFLLYSIPLNTRSITPLHHF